MSRLVQTLILAALTTQLLGCCELFPGLCGGPADDDDSADPYTWEEPEDGSYYTACYAWGAGGGGGGGQGYQPSDYVLWRLDQTLALLGISGPQGGIWETPGVQNAFYDPNGDVIAFDGYWLMDLNQTVANMGYGSYLEGGDSVIYHEIGHMWAFKSGVGVDIGYGSQDQNWEQELTADCISGHVLGLLGGNPIPSQAIYDTVLSGWSGSHPPGSMRSDRFMQCYDEAVSVARDDDQVVDDSPEWLQYTDALENLRRLDDVRSEMIEAGLDPFDPALNDVFEALFVPVESDPTL